MDTYKELIWFWYIFENRTVGATYELLHSRMVEDQSHLIVQPEESISSTFMKYAISDIVRDTKC